MASQIPVAYAGKQAAFTHAVVPGGLNQVVAVGSSSTQSNVLNTNTSIVRVVSTTNCFLAFGTAPTATSASGVYLPANVIDYFGVADGSKIAVIQSAASGSLYIAEGT